MDDFKWQSAASLVAHGEIIPVGDINIFIGYVGSQSCTDSNHDTEPIVVKLGDSAEGYAEFIHQVLDDENLCDSENDSISSGFTDPVGVYMAGDILRTPHDSLSTPITTDKAAARAAELEWTRAKLAEAQRELIEKEKQTIASQKALESRLTELQSISEYNRKNRLRRANIV
jgi:hypothetical protein